MPLTDNGHLHPRDYRMTGDHATASEMLNEITAIRKEARERYDWATTHSDPKGRRAWAEVLSALDPIETKYAIESQRDRARGVT